MPRWFLVASLMLAHTVAPAHAAPAVDIHASCAARLVDQERAEHVRTLHRAVAAELDGLAATGSTIDVALVRLETVLEGTQLAVRAEVRALVSDARGEIRWTTLARATARGARGDRALLQHDAVDGAARELGKQVRTRLASR